MLLFSTPDPRRCASTIALACVLAIGSGGVVHAAEHADHDEPVAAKAGHGAAAKSAARADAPAPARAGQPAPEATANAKSPARGTAAAARDPMDLVRERLAEKLGATKPPEAPNPNVLRVTSRASMAETAPARVAAGHGDGGHGDGGPAAPARARMPSNRSTTLAAVNRELAGGAARPAVEAAVVPPVLPLPLPSHWEYQGAGGPDVWGQMKPEFSKCSSGTRQSPIDIRDGVKVQLDEVQFDYKPTGFRVIDNGHTVQVNVGSGNSIEVLGRRYDLLQFHFHRPSEERINGRQFEMVAHLVHKDLEGRLAVVAVLLDRGAAQPIIQAVWNNLPLEKGEEVAAQMPLDLNALLPADRSYYTYMGSLTTPPCSEGVLWMVLKNPVQISPQQVSIFSRLYPMNARPIQSASGRLIKESN